MKEVIARLKEHQSPTPSKWRDKMEGTSRVEATEQIVVATLPAYCCENA